MKRSTLLPLLVVSMCGTGALASPQTFVNEQGEHEIAPAPTAEEIQEALEGAAEDETEQRRGVWHCTAYPEGHGHTGGFNYSDPHYDHAYQGALRTCETRTRHHCHDVHCHID